MGSALSIFKAIAVGAIVRGKKMFFDDKEIFFEILMANSSSFIHS